MPFVFGLVSSFALEDMPGISSRPPFDPFAQAQVRVQQASTGEADACGFSRGQDESFLRNHPGTININGSWAHHAKQSWPVTKGTNTEPSFGVSFAHGSFQPGNQGLRPAKEP